MFDEQLPFNYFMWAILIGLLALVLLMLSITAPDTPGAQPFFVGSVLAAGVLATAAVGIAMKKRWGRAIFMVVLAITIVAMPVLIIVDLVRLGAVAALFPRVGVMVICGVFLWIFWQRADDFE